MKRVLTAVLACMLVLGLFGCGAEEAAPVQTVPETTAPAETTVPPTEAETEPPIMEPVFDLSTWQGNYDQGLYFMEEKRWQEAYDAFDAAVALDSQQPDGYAQRANALILAEENEENLSFAWEDYQQALALDETNALAYLGIVDVHIRRAEYEDALSAAKTAAEKNPDPAISDKLTQMETGMYRDASGYARFKWEQHYYQDRYVGKTEFTYNDHGYYSSAKAFDSKGKLVSSLDLESSIDGNIEKVDSCIVHKNIGFLFLTKRTYVTTSNPDGSSIRESITYDRDGKVTSSDKAWYDADNLRTRLEGYDADGVMTGYTLYEYDNAGNCVRNNYYKPDGTFDQFTLSEYDEKGRQVRYEYHDASGVLTGYNLEIYDENGNHLGHESYSADGTLQWSTVGQ